MKNKSGFTLIEILAVIIILGVLLGVGVLAYNKIIIKGKISSFYDSVVNIKNSIQTNQILSENDYCVYDYSKEENQSKLIKELYILVHKDKETDETIYSVYAKYNGLISGKELIIDAYDFSKIKENNHNEWNACRDGLSDNEYCEDSYTLYSLELINSYDELLDYKLCKSN